MREKLRFLGLDVHAESIAGAGPDREAQRLGTMANREESIRKLIRKLSAVEHLRACYEPARLGLTSTGNCRNVSKIRA